MTPSSRLPTLVSTLALLGALATAPAFAVPTVSIGGPSLVGGAFQLNVSASGFTDLYAYQFDVSFDPTLFAASGVSQGGFLGAAGTTFFDAGTIDNATGTISFIFESLIGPDPGASGDGDLAQLSFDVVGPRFNSGSFVITNFIAFDSALNSIDVALQDASVSIPEPSSLALAMLAVGAGFIGTSRRARRRADEATGTA